MKLQKGCNPEKLAPTKCVMNTQNPAQLCHGENISMFTFFLKIFIFLLCIMHNTDSFTKDFQSMQINC